MDELLKIKLLKRKFLSANYIKEFLDNYKKFHETGLAAFNAYQRYRRERPEFEPNDTLLREEDFWENRVCPNFEGNLGAMREVEALISRNDHRTNMYLDGLAGDFRGISRGFDGIEENFMDVATPEMRKEYLRLYKLTIRKAMIIEATINGWWNEGEILDEEITGPIDEQELLNYLKPDEDYIL